MPPPNFLIVGTAKGGTSSLYQYLKRHPDIYMSLVKEPKFFLTHFLNFPRKGIGDELADRIIVKDYKNYLALFSDVRDEKKIGEASTMYLYYYENTIPKIKEMLGDIQIIIILRNPIDRAFSAYMHLVGDGREHLSFEDGLKEEENRIKDWAGMWHYTRVGFYYRQVKAYLENFTQVKICLFDDLKADPAKLVQEVFEFLGVDDTFVPDNIGERYTITGQPRYQFVYNILTKQNPLRSILNPLLRLTMGIEKTQQLKQNIRKFFLNTKPEMDIKIKKQLNEIFIDDILALQTLINKDLTHWLK